jgi:TonB-linked SusC/RagA family outer membrane protein
MFVTRKRIFLNKNKSMKRICLLFVVLMMMGITAMAQDDDKAEGETTTTHTITGKVLDEHGKAYKGASVCLRGTQIGTVTDENGDFSLEVPDEKNTIVVSAFGYSTTTSIDEGAPILIKLEAISNLLEGNLVAPFDFTKSKRQVGYNSTTVDYEELMRGNNTSVITSLQGKVAGANITSSTSGPGSSSRMVMRGEKSFMLNNNPIIVVDGVITNNYDRTLLNQLAQVDFGNSTNDLNTEEIESVSVLPGGAAAALYGAMASSGAIMITTKKGKHSENGKDNKLAITYKATYTQSDVLKYPDMQHIYGQGNMYDGIADDRREYRSWGLPLDGGWRPWGQIIDGKQLVKRYEDQPHNMKSFFDHGRNLNNYVSMSGGTEKTTYYFSLDALNSSNVIPNNFYNRYTLRFNGSTQLTHNLYSTINVNYINTYTKVETSGEGDGSVLNSLYNTPRDIPVWELKDQGNPFYSMQHYDTFGVQRYGQYNGSFANPYWVSKNYDNRNKTDRVVGDLKLGWKYCDWHVFDRLGVDVAADRSYYKSPTINAYPVDPFYSAASVNDLLSANPGLFPVSPTYNFISPGGLMQSNRNVMTLTNDLIVNFNHKLSPNFGMNAFVGHNTTMQADEMLSATLDPATGGLELPNLFHFSNNAGAISASNDKVLRRTHGVFADFNFNYREELFLELSGRNDWSSTLAEDRRSYFYPAVNGAWVFTERLHGSGFKNHFMNFGKVRFAMSGTSKDAVPYANNPAGFWKHSFATTNASIGGPLSPAFTYSGTPVYQVMDRFGDNNLRPERTRDYEVGADMGFLRNRITASFTYYSSITYGMIAMVNVPASSGYLYNYQNVGDITNKGFEVAMRGTPINTKYGLRWDLFGTFTRNRSMVRSLNDSGEHVVLGGYDGVQVVAAAGKPYGTFYGSDIQYWQDPADGKWHPVVDQATGQPLADPTKVYKGSFQPKFIASWGTDISFKGIRLHALFVTKQGGQFFSRNKLLLNANGNSQETTTNNRNAYVLPNSVYRVDNTNIYLDNTTKFLPYDYYTKVQSQTVPMQGLVDASYVKLQELSLSYQIPPRYYCNSPFGNLEAGIFGSNLALWTAKSNQFDDPEAAMSAGATGNGQGFNYTSRPSLRNYGVYLKVNF